MSAAPLVFDDYFSGAGLVPAALLPAGWVSRFAIDINPVKGAVYSTNWGSHGLKIADVAQLTPGDIPPGRADLSWASFPCVDVSEAGRGVGLEGERSGTFWPYINLTKALKAEGRGPRVIAVENVVGLISGRDGRDFLAAVTALMDLGYVVGACVLDASDWLPQERKRVFIIGVDQDIPIPAGLTSSEPIGHFTPTNLRRIIAGLPPEPKAKWRWWALPTAPGRTADLVDILVDTPAWDSPGKTVDLLHMLSPKSRLEVDKARESGVRVVGAGFRRTRSAGVQFEVRFDGICGCLRTASGGSSRQIILEIEGDRTRSRLMSPREAARAMGLNDTFNLPPALNDALSAMGDGVAVPCVQFLDRHLFRPLLQPAQGNYAMASEAEKTAPNPDPANPPNRYKAATSALEYDGVPIGAEALTRLRDQAAELSTAISSGAVPTPGPQTAKPNPFDIKRLRITPKSMVTASVRKLLTTVPVGKPSPQEFFRVHSDPAYRDTFATLEWKEDREFYIVAPDMVAELQGECVNVALYTSINRQGVIRLIPVKLPGLDGRVLEAHRSLQEAVERAMIRWIRSRWSKPLGAYEIFEASLSIPQPDWDEALGQPRISPDEPQLPNISFQDLLQIGFRDRLIETSDHPLIRKLRGLV